MFTCLAHPQPLAPSAPTHQSPLGWVLIHQHSLTPAQLTQALQIQSQRPEDSQINLGTILLAYQMITPRQLQRALEEQKWRRKNMWVIG